MEGLDYVALEVSQCMEVEEGSQVPQGVVQLSQILLYWRCKGPGTSCETNICSAHRVKVV